MRRALNAQITTHDARRMDRWRQSDWVEVRRATNRGRGGRGVFAVRDIPAGTVVERVPVLLIAKGQVFNVADPDGPSPGPDVSWYVFDWPDADDGAFVGLALGYGSIYNHSADPNMAWDAEPPDTLAFRTTRAVAKGAELLISYLPKGGDAGHDLGFTPE